MITINTVLCAALFYTCFCRLVRTNADTAPGVRLAFCVLAIVAAGCLGAPFVMAYVPPVPALAMEGAMVFVQGITAKYWRHGVPCHFQVTRPMARDDLREVHP